jgi:hypothetical protein
LARFPADSIIAPGGGRNSDAGHKPCDRRHIGGFRFDLYPKRGSGARLD